MLETINNNEQSEESKKGRLSFIFDTWFGKWFIQRFPALLVWVWLILRFLNVPLPLAPHLPREWLLLPCAASALMMLVAGRGTRLGLYPFYIILFPFLAIFLIGRAFYRLFQIPFQTGRFLSSSRAAAIFLIVATIAWALSFALDNINGRAIASIVALSVTFLLLIQFFRWAANPYRPLTTAAEFFSTKITPWIEGQFIAPGRSGNGRQRQTAATYCEWILKGIDRIQPSDPTPEEGVTGFATARLVPLAISMFIVAYLILATSFAMVLLRSQDAWGPQIVGLGENPGFGDFLYFTLLAQATEVASSVVPTTSFGQVLIAWMVLTGILLLTLLIALFTTSIGVHGESAIETLRNQITLERERYTEWLVELPEPEGSAEPDLENQLIHPSSQTDDG